MPHITLHKISKFSFSYTPHPLHPPHTHRHQPCQTGSSAAQKLQWVTVVTNTYGSKRWLENYTLLQRIRWTAKGPSLSVVHRSTGLVAKNCGLLALGTWLHSYKQSKCQEALWQNNVMLGKRERETHTPTETRRKRAREGERNETMLYLTTESLLQQLGWATHLSQMLYISIYSIKPQCVQYPQCPHTLSSPHPPHPPPTPTHMRTPKMK